MELDKELPFEALLKLEEKLGSKNFRKMQAKNRNEVTTLLPKGRKNQTTQDSSDEAPEEMSSKKQPKQTFVKVPRSQRPARSIDPRFDPRTGSYKPTHFHRNFQFAFDLKEQELEQLKKLSTPSNSNPEEKEKAKYLVQRMENQKREQQRVLSKKVKPVISKDGTKYFPSKKELLAQELVAKFEELKKSGKLQTHMEKRRKKQAGKERKRMDIEKT